MRYAFPSPSAADGGFPLGRLTREERVREGDVAGLRRELRAVREVEVDERLELRPVLRLADVRVDEQRAGERGVAVVVDRGLGRCDAAAAVVDLEGLQLVLVLDVVGVAEEADR